MKKVFLYNVTITAIFVFVLWNWGYPFYMYYLEGNSYFSTAPDFANIQLSMPGDYDKYIGAFLLQFFRFGVANAVIQSLFATIVMACSTLIIKQIFGNERLLWLAAIPTSIFISGQFADESLARSVDWAAVMLILAVLAGLVRRRVPLKLDGSIRALWGYVLVVVLVGGACLKLATKDENRAKEKDCYLYYLCENGQWHKVLDIVTADGEHDTSMRQHIGLLAAAQLGQLEAYLDFFNARDESSFMYTTDGYQSEMYFNMLFFRYLEIDNLVIQNAYQAATQSRDGMTFRCLRALAEAYTRLGERELAERYIKLLEFSSCHDSWAKKQRELLATAPAPGRETDDDALWGSKGFNTEVAHLIDRHPDNKLLYVYLLANLKLHNEVTRYYQVLQLYNAHFGTN